MKDTRKSALGTMSLLGLVLAIALLHVGGWDNFKLRYFHLTLLKPRLSIDKKLRLV